MVARPPPTTSRGNAKPAAPRRAAKADAWTPAKLHRMLRAAYGPQRDWWPVDRAWHEARGTDPRFEIVLGALLAQNTAWTNVEKALRELKKHDALDPRVLLAADPAQIEAWVRSSGTYREKARRIAETLRYFQERGNLDLSAFAEAASMAPGQARRELLGLHGVGPETADTILLYALGFPFFVVDAYTKRLLGRIGVMPGATGAPVVQAWFVEGMKPDTATYAEFHALLVEHAKARCRSDPLCAGCPLLSGCATGRRNVAARTATAAAKATATTTGTTRPPAKPRTANRGAKRPEQAAKPARAAKARGRALRRPAEAPFLE